MLFAHRLMKLYTQEVVLDADHALFAHNHMSQKTHDYVQMVKDKVRNSSKKRR